MKRGLFLSSKGRLGRRGFKSDFSDNKNYFASDFIRSRFLPFYQHRAWWGFSNSRRCQMLEADSRQEEGIFTKYQGYFIWRRITPSKGEVPFWQCWNLQNSPSFTLSQLKILMGISKPFGVWICAFHIHELTSPSPQNTLAEQCSCAQSSALLNLMTWHLFLFSDFISSISLVKYILFFHALKIKANSHQQSFVHMRQHVRSWFVWPG